MARTSAATKDPLSGDIHRPIDDASAAKGWNNLEEECEYWVPPSDIIGEIPRNLRGTLFRNGPGVNEIYGKKLVHREQEGWMFLVTEAYIAKLCRAAVLCS